MKSIKKYSIVLSMLLVIILFVISAYYIFFMKPFSKELDWVSDMYMQCIDTAVDIDPDTLYWDIQEVMQGSYSKDKLEIYTNKIKQYSEGKCSNDDLGLCKDSYLYVLRTFLARGSDKDIRLALSSLDQYKEMQGINIYYDPIFLDVSLYYEWKQKVKDKYYGNLIDEVRSHYVKNDYFEKPHGVLLCNLYLNYIGVAYAKSGNDAADLYIQYHIQK